MKKFLSLVLALAMTMSLVTVSAGAKDFTDNSKIDYKEAVDVVSSVGIVDGYEDGAFNPQNTLTRGAAAKIICNLILGPTTASALRADTAPYSDVPTTNNFSGYIAYCQKEGIISGYADGTFKPGASLTGYAFMKMLLGALGYDSSIEGYTGANWSIAVGKRAIGIGLDDGNDNFVGVNAVTREEACLYAFNTMKATMVDYDSKITVDTNDGGSVTVGNNSAYELSNSSKTDGYIKDDGKMQFAEKYFDKLKGVADTDDFGRPATTWKYDGDTIGTYADDADATYVVEDAKKDLSVLVTDSDYLGYSAKDVKDTADVYRNGKLMGEYADLDNKDTLAGKGDIIEAYENDDNDVATIVIRSYTYAKIDDVDNDLSSSLKNKGASVGVDLKDIDGTNMGTYYDNHDDDDKVLNGFDADTYEEGTVLAVAISDKDDTTILDSYVAKSVKGTPTAARQVAKDSTYNVTAGDITIDGTKYVYAAQMTGIEDGENVDFDNEYTVYLTAEGYALAVDGAAFATLDDVYYVAGVYTENTRGTINYYAQAISVTDGTEHQLKLAGQTAGDLTYDADDNKFDNQNTTGLYVMTEDDDKYTAKKYIGQDGYTVVEDTLSSSVDSASTVIRFTASGKNAYNNSASKNETASRLYLDDTTFFIGIEKDSTDIDIKTATGKMSVDKASSGLNVYAIYKDGKDDAVFVIYAATKLDGAVNKDDVVYLTDDAKTSVKDGYSVELYFMKDMKSETVTIEDKESQGFYTYTVDKDGIYDLKTSTGYALTAGEVESGDDGYASGVVFDSTKNTTVSGKAGSVEFVATSAADATVIDTRDNTDKKADVYSNDITSVSRLTAAIEKGDVTADVYVEDGDIVFVAVTACENAKADDTQTNVNAADYNVSYSGNTVNSVLVYTNVLDKSTAVDVRNMVIAAIEKCENSTVEEISSVGATYTFKMANKTTYTWDSSTNAAKAAVKISVNGKDQLVDATTQLNSLKTASETYFMVNGKPVELTSHGTDKVADNSVIVTGYYKVTAPATLEASGQAGKYSAKVDKEYAQKDEVVTVTITTETAALSGADTITLTGVTGGTAATGAKAAALNESITLTYVMGAADSNATISAANA